MPTIDFGSPFSKALSSLSETAGGFAQGRLQAQQLRQRDEALKAQLSQFNQELSLRQQRLAFEMDQAASREQQRMAALEQQQAADEVARSAFAAVYGGASRGMPSGEVGPPVPPDSTPSPAGDRRAIFSRMVQEGNMDPSLVIRLDEYLTQLEQQEAEAQRVSQVRQETEQIIERIGARMMETAEGGQMGEAETTALAKVTSLYDANPDEGLVAAEQLAEQLAKKKSFEDGLADVSEMASTMLREALKTPERAGNADEAREYINLALMGRTKERSPSDISDRFKRILSGEFVSDAENPFSGKRFKDRLGIADGNGQLLSRMNPAQRSAFQVQVANAAEARVRQITQMGITPVMKRTNTGKIDIQYKLPDDLTADDMRAVVEMQMQIATKELATQWGWAMPDSGMAILPAAASARLDGIMGLEPNVSAESAGQFGEVPPDIMASLFAERDQVSPTTPESFTQKREELDKREQEASQELEEKSKLLYGDKPPKKTATKGGVYPGFRPKDERDKAILADVKRLQKELVQIRKEKRDLEGEARKLTPEEGPQRVSSGASGFPKSFKEQT